MSFEDYMDDPVVQCLQAVRQECAKARFTYWGANEDFYEGFMCHFFMAKVCSNAMRGGQTLAHASQGFISATWLKGSCNRGE